MFDSSRIDRTAIDLDQLGNRLVLRYAVAVPHKLPTSERRLCARHVNAKGGFTEVLVPSTDKEHGRESQLTLLAFRLRMTMMSSSRWGALCRGHNIYGDQRKWLTCAARGRMFPISTVRKRSHSPYSYADYFAIKSG